MAAAAPPLQHVVESAEDLVGSQHLASKGLKVVEVHSWGGPCKSVLPTFKRIRIEKDNEAALTFLVVDADNIAAPASAPVTAAPASRPSTHAAAPAGAAPPPPQAAPRAAPLEGLQAVLEHAGRSEPLFLLYRNGQLKARVAGANLPQLTALVMENTPNNAELDDLEDNPFHVARSGAGGSGAKGKGKKK